MICKKFCLKKLRFGKIKLKSLFLKHDFGKKNIFKKWVIKQTQSQCHRTLLALPNQHHVSFQIKAPDDILLGQLTGRIIFKCCQAQFAPKKMNYVYGLKMEDTR